MKLKYYLRGLGIGIVVTAILMGVATKGNGQMTDAEVKERAAQLGMVESKVLADIAGNNVVEPSLEGSEETVKTDTEKQPDTETEPNGGETQPEGATEPDNVETQPEEATEPDNAEAQPEGVTESEDAEKQPEDITATEEGKEPGTAQETIESGEVIQITIRSGETSWSVSKALAECGLIDDASAFDKFLSRGGYDKSICVGEFDILMGASYEEIAKIITKRD